MAAGYDAAFTDTTVGRALRSIVWQRVAALVPPESRVLELNCGTGADAVWLGARGNEVMATDASVEMVEVASRRVAVAGLGDRVTVRQMAFDELAGGLVAERFDAVLSDFGGLNCASSLEALADDLATLLRPGGVAVLVPMGRFVPWEWAWFGLRGDLRKAGRRLRGRANWQGLVLQYPTPRRLRAVFGRDFEVLAVRPLGVAIPPSFAIGFVDRHPRLWAVLVRAEAVLARVPGTAWLSDHVIVELRRR